MTDQEKEKLFMRGYIKMVLLFLAIIGIPLILYSVWTAHSGQKQEDNSNVEQFQAATKTYEDAMRADTFGGKTPQETLNMFIDALKKGDVELASKYFLLEQNTNDPNYLTRKKWEEQLLAAKQQNRLSDIANILIKAVPDESNISGSDDYKFAVYSSTTMQAYVNMQLNKFSSVWKIESL